MLFATKYEALNHASQPYMKESKMTLMDYSNELKELINDWYETEDKAQGQIIIEEDENWGIKDLYYYEKINIFPKDEDKIRIGIASFIVGWHKQYLNWMIERGKCDSKNYIFVGYITKEEIENKNAILSEIVRRIF